MTIAAPIPESKIMAAIAWRRSKMPWLEIGRRLGLDKDRIRKAVTERGYVDGWGPASLIRAGSWFAGAGQPMRGSGLPMSAFKVNGAKRKR